MSWTQPFPSFYNCHRARRSVSWPAIWRVSAQRWNGVLNSLRSSRTKTGCAQRFSLPTADGKRPASPISSPATAVRHALGVSFSGEDYPADFMMADVQVDWKLPRDQLAFFFRAEGWFAFFPLPRGRATVAADIGPAQGHHPPVGEPALEDLQAIFNIRTPGGVLSDPIWKVYYRVHCRQAERYQVGRVFLVGD